jgi:DNA polymerase III subunit epsilon
MKTIWIDTETTGTDPMRHALIQVAGIIYVDQEKTETFNLRCRPFPNDAIEPSALEVIKMSREQVLALPEPKDLMDQLEKGLSRHVDKFDKHDKFILRAYNARFDYDFLRRLFEKCGNKYFGSWIWFPPIDIMNYAAEALCAKREQLVNFKLSTVAEFFSVKPDGDLHDALTDIRLAKALYERISLLRGEKAGFEILDDTALPESPQPQ